MIRMKYGESNKNQVGEEKVGNLCTKIQWGIFCLCWADWNISKVARQSGFPTQQGLWKLAMKGANQCIADLIDERIPSSN